MVSLIIRAIVIHPRTHKRNTNTNTIEVQQNNRAQTQKRQNEKEQKQNRHQLQHIGTRIQVWSNLRTNPNLDIWTLDCLSLVFFLSKDGVIDNRSCRDPTMHCVLASFVTKKSRNPSQNKHFKIICTHTNSSKVKLNHGFPMWYFFLHIDLLFWWYKEIISNNVI